MGVSIVTIDGWTGRARNQLSAALLGAGCTDPAVLRAMARVPREKFLAEELREEAYLERALPIGEGQHIASASMVARTLQLLAPTAKDRILEIGTGTGYSAAVTSLVAGEVYTVERNANLARAAGCFLGRCGYKNVHVRQGEGAEGWREAGPFDAVSVTFSAPSLVRPLLQQLKVGGRLVMAMGNPEVMDALLLVTRTPSAFLEDSMLGLRSGPAVSVHPLAAAPRAMALPYPRPCA